MVENNLEDILMRRVMPQASSNLAERIIAAAPAKRERRRFGVWVSDFLDSFALPQPALAPTFVLVLGVFVGWSAMPQTDDTSDSISSYLYMNEVLNMGDWLL